MDNYEQVYWDSSVWIAVIKAEIINGVNRFEIPKLILEDAEKEKVTIYISRATIVEVHKKRHGSSLTKKEDDRVQRDFFLRKFIKHIDVDKWIATTARNLAWEYNVLPMDAIHAASALRVKAEVLHYWDGDYGKIPNEVLLCEKPTDWKAQPSLDLSPLK